MVCRPGIHATTPGAWIPALDHKLRSNHKNTIPGPNQTSDRARADTFFVISSSESRKGFSEVWKKKSVELEWVLPQNC